MPLSKTRYARIPAEVEVFLFTEESMIGASESKVPTWLLSRIMNNEVLVYRNRDGSAHTLLHGKNGKLHFADHGSYVVLNNGELEFWTPDQFVMLYEAIFVEGQSDET